MTTENRKIYRGLVGIDGAQVLVTVVSIDGAQVTDSTTEPLNHIVRHSPDGFSWGFHGSGPAELAHCLLVDHLGAEVEPAIYQQFKAEVIAALVPTDGWMITAEYVEEWLRSNGFGCRDCGQRGFHLTGCSENERPGRRGFTADIVNLDEAYRFVAETEMVDNEVEQLSAMVECEVCGFGPAPAVEMVRERDGWVCWPCSRGEGQR